MRNLFFRALIALSIVVALTACGDNNVAPTAPPPLAPTTRATSVSATRAPAQPTNATIPTIPPSRKTNNAQTNVCPFTGLPLSPSALSAQGEAGVNLAARRPLLIKIGNSPPERPQAGLAQADIVVEHLTEGAITRYAALFYCNDANEIGPIRSARLIDLELVPMFGAIFAHVGGSEPVRQMIAASEIAQADFDDYGRAPIFREITERKRPFNRYTSTQEMYALAAQKNLLTGAQIASLNFNAAVPSGGRAANQATIPYRKNLSDAIFVYDAQRQVYVRSIGASPHLDAVSKQPLTAANVLVLHATHETTDIIEDSLGSRSIKITLTGSGKATLLRDGQAFDVTWTRNDPHTFFELTTANGAPIAFKPGNIWIQVAPPEMQVTIQ